MSDQTRSYRAIANWLVVLSAVALLIGIGTALLLYRRGGSPNLILLMSTALPLVLSLVIREHIAGRSRRR